MVCSMGAFDMGGCYLGAYNLQATARCSAETIICAYIVGSTTCVPTVCKAYCLGAAGVGKIGDQ